VANDLHGLIGVGARNEGAKSTRSVRPGGEGDSSAIDGGESGRGGPYSVTSLEAIQSALIPRSNPPGGSNRNPGTGLSGASELSAGDERPIAAPGEAGGPEDSGATAAVVEVEGTLHGSWGPGQAAGSPNPLRSSAAGPGGGSLGRSAVDALWSLNGSTLAGGEAGVSPTLLGWYRLGAPGPRAGGRLGFPTGAEGLDLGLDLGEAMPSPRNSDLLTDFLPFDRSSLEEAIDRFLDSFEGLGAELAEWPSLAGLVPAATAIVLASLASTAARRGGPAGRGAGRRAGEEGEDPDLLRFPGHPGLWGLGES
jgi:hypothetical protein